MNDIFNQQQAKTHKEVVEKKVGTGYKVQQKKMEWTKKQ